MRELPQLNLSEIISSPYVKIYLIVPRLEQFDGLMLDEKTRENLLKISPAAIAAFAGQREKKPKLKGRRATKPGTLLKRQISIRTLAKWDEARPGFLEIDLVSHNGESSREDFGQTLDMVDIFSGWTEMRAVRNKKRPRKLYTKLNPAELLRRQINRLQDNLYKLCTMKEKTIDKGGLEALDFEYILNDATKDHGEYISQ